jgi:di/tricarboxylate transporter
MTPEIISVLAILTAAVILFITEWVRMDLVGLLVMASLGLTGLVTPAQSLSGFSNPAVITVWAVLILSGALGRTGVASILGKFVLRLAGDNEVRLLIVIMLTTGFLSGFMNSIGVASLFLPVVIDIARRTNRPPSRLLMPLAFACLMGGLTTLIGTPPNLLISESLNAANLVPFTMFDFTPVGISVVLVGTLFMVLVGRHLLPERDITRELSSSSGDDVASLYDLEERLVFLNIPDNSTLNGKTLQESRLGSALELNVVTVIRDSENIMAPGPNFSLQSGDRLLVEGRLDRLFEIHDNDHLSLTKENLPLETIISSQINLAELNIIRGSELIGSTLPQTAFRHRYGAIVIAIRRGDQLFRSNLERIKLEEQDFLLVQGNEATLDLLKNSEQFTYLPEVSYQKYNLQDRLMSVRIPPGSTLDGTTLKTSRLGDAYGLSVLGILRGETTRLMPDPEEEVFSGDTLILKGKLSDLQMIEGLQELIIETQTEPDLSDLETEETGLLEAVLSPHSSLAGKAVRELNFRAKYGLTILAIWREGRAYRSRLRDMKLRFGDALLLFGPRRRLRLLVDEPDFLSLTESIQPAPRLNKAPLAILIMLAVLIPVIIGWIPIAVAAVTGAALMVLTGCLSMEEAYLQIEWKAVFLIAGMLPLGIAMETSGAASMIGTSLINLIGDFGPTAVAAGLFLLAALGSQFMPNPAVAVLLAPIALTAAGNLGVSPYPLMMVVAVSSSAAFLSPVGHAANMLVMGPGGYKFSDYIKVGLPLTIIVLVTVLLILPLFWSY